MEKLLQRAVTPQEWHIISTVREVPESKLRTLLQDVLVELAEYVSEPSCPEVQADGVPCSTPSADCEQCLKLSGMLTQLRASLGKH